LSFSANCENVSTTIIRTSKGDGKKHLGHRWMSRCQIFLQGILLYRLGINKLGM
ncbi:unnamed protein product, partial [Musa hybrid cultivar]